jgi:hypothetical protein
VDVAARLQHLQGVGLRLELGGHLECSSLGWLSAGDCLLARARPPTLVGGWA